MRREIGPQTDPDASSLAVADGTYQTNTRHPQSVQNAGKGTVVLRNAPPNSQVLSSLAFQYPLKLISPRLSNEICTLVFMMSYGGGLVGGDLIELDVDVGKGCKLALLTQGSTKVFKSKNRQIGQSTPLDITKQSLRCKVQVDGLLALLPDPLQPFADSNFEQYQSFELHHHSNLILLDWICCGRPARGEKWLFENFRSRNEIWETIEPSDVVPEQGLNASPNRRLILRDTLLLAHSVPETMQSNGCFATLILRGPRLQILATNILERFNKEDQVRRTSTVTPEWQRKKVIWTAGMVREGCCVVKAAGEGTEYVKELIRDLIKELEETIGEEALRALR